MWLPNPWYISVVVYCFSFLMILAVDPNEELTKNSVNLILDSPDFALFSVPIPCGQLIANWQSLALMLSPERNGFPFPQKGKVLVRNNQLPKYKVGITGWVAVSCERLWGVLYLNMSLHALLLPTKAILALFSLNRSVVCSRYEMILLGVDKASNRARFPHLTFKKGMN